MIPLFFFWQNLIQLELILKLLDFYGTPYSKQQTIISKNPTPMRLMIFSRSMWLNPLMLEAFFCKYPYPRTTIYLFRLVSHFHYTPITIYWLTLWLSRSLIWILLIHSFWLWWDYLISQFHLSILHFFIQGPWFFNILIINIIVVYF